MANSLNITTANFGKDDDYMFLDDPALYLDFHDGGGLLSIGYLEADKVFKQTVEYAVFKTGIPKTEIRRDIIDQEFTIESTIKQLQPETIALVSQRYYDESGTYRRVVMGSKAPAPLFPSCVLIGQTVDGSELRLYIRRLQITAEDLETVLGGDDYASIPFKGTAQKDTAPLTTNPTWDYNAALGTLDDIAFWAWPKAASSSSS